MVFVFNLFYYSETLSQICHNMYYFEIDILKKLNFKNYNLLNINKTKLNDKYSFLNK
jgi:hypothetical protein